MLDSSFRLVASRLIPRGNRCKQALLLAACILAGCGGSRAKNTPPAAWQTVRVADARFEVPAAWSVVGGKTGAKASAGADQIEVDTFPLVHPYTAALFSKVEPELKRVVAAVAVKTGGTVGGHSVVTAGGIRSHSYVVQVGKRGDTYTFVLHGKREYELICSADQAVCDHLVSSFSF